MSPASFLADHGGDGCGGGGEGVERASDGADLAEEHHIEKEGQHSSKEHNDHITPHDKRIAGRGTARESRAGLDGVDVGVAVQEARHGDERPRYGDEVRNRGDAHDEVEGVAEVEVGPEHRRKAIQRQDESRGEAKHGEEVVDDAQEVAGPPATVAVVVAVAVVVVVVVVDALLKPLPRGGGEARGKDDGGDD